ncbi:hypothetical protein [Methyloprofundus sp.]|uniref:hypothetical protein n=1 Tax=Methyloprofundus sp. TaxID=2020875 RepID=UPI003D10F7E4
MGLQDLGEILISCGLAQYSIKQGIAKSTLLLIDGPKLFLRGNEEVNLGKETINAYYNLQKKNIFENTLFLDSFNTHVPIKVSGNIIDPVVEQAPLESLESKASRYVFAPVATIPREVIATVLDIFEDNREEAQSPCKEFLQH